MKAPQCKAPVIYRTPRTTQKTIPVNEVYEDGMMRHGPIYSICVAVDDMNYAATSEEYQAGILLGFEEIIKAIPPDVSIKVVLRNRLIDAEKLARSISIPMQGGHLDALRRELNEINCERALEGESNITRDRYLVLSGERSTRQEASAWFRRLRETLFRDINALGTTAHQMGGEERLADLAGFFRPRVPYRPAELRHGRTLSHGGCRRHFLDRIAPDAIEFPLEGSYFKIDDRFGRALMIRDFPANMDDSLLGDLMNMPREMIASADYAVMAKETALRITNMHRDTIEGDIRKRTVNSSKEGNWNASVPRALQEQRDTCDYIFDILNQEDQRLVLAQVTLVHLADSKAQLDLDTAAIQAAARGKGAEVGILRHRQERGLNTALPYGPDYISQRRIVSSENASFLIPFRTQEIAEEGGIVYGINEISRSIIRMNRMHYKNGNAFIVGDAGGGKSVLAKTEMYAVYLSTQDDMIILDPDGEYSRIVEWLGGQVVHISAESRDHINLMDMSQDFDASDDAITLKCSLISGAVDLMMRSHMTGAQRSVLDRCVHHVLIHAGPDGVVPTLRSLHSELLRQKESAAAEIALAMELFATGSLNTFAQETNVNIQGRLLCFDIQRLSPQLRDLGMMVVLDEIDRRVARNRKNGIHTWIWVDEIWSLLHYPATEEYLWSFWKRCRKYGGLPTGITQSLNAVKSSEKGREMISNSEFVFMMGMSADDRAGAAELFGLSEDQQGYLMRAVPGHGLIRAGKNIVPLDATIPRESEIYRVATTKLDEVAKMRA